MRVPAYSLAHGQDQGGGGVWVVCAAPGARASRGSTRSLHPQARHAVCGPPPARAGSATGGCGGGQLRRRPAIVKSLPRSVGRLSRRSNLSGVSSVEANNAFSTSTPRDTNFLNK